MSKKGFATVMPSMYTRLHSSSHMHHSEIAGLNVVIVIIESLGCNVALAVFTYAIPDIGTATKTFMNCPLDFSK